MVWNWTVDRLLERKEKKTRDKSSGLVTHTSSTLNNNIFKYDKNEIGDACGQI
jgi:hypothetical protein